MPLDRPVMRIIVGTAPAYRRYIVALKYLHTMVRVKDLEASMRFYALLGLKETRRFDNEGGRFSLVFMAPEGQEDCPVELTYNWDPEE